MTDDRPPNAVAALEQARAQLEIALGANAHWRALRQATLPANRVAHERALADNPVYHAWKLLGQGLGELQAGGAMERATRTDMATDMVPEGTALAAVPPQASRPRVELRQVLERIRVEAPVDNAGPAAGATAAADHDPGAPPAAPAIAPADIEIEEADVSFVVRKPAQPTPQAAPAAEPAVEPRGTQGGTREGAGASATATDSSNEKDDTETEVRIVPRRR